MYLSELEIVGFKSFGQKLSLKFGDGITAIVGPNGCGKTNLVDAIRWVLGEQRTTTLRTDRMEEVIFNGSNGRKPLGMAEVSLTIDNTKNILPVEFSQVQVTRRLFRSGESGYLLNRAPCRLRDIIDLFLDTGMGAHAYSVIELSMVDDILSDRAEARRRLFDEASGVMKYKARRHEATNKLRATEADLVRINDIVSEVEKKVRSLKYQVGKARRYETYQQRLKRLEIASARRDREAILEQLAPLQEKLARLREEQVEAAEIIATKEDELQRFRAQYADQSREQTHLQSQIQGCTDKIHKAEEHLSVCRERRRSLEERIGRNEEEVKGLKQRLGVVRNQRKKSGHELRKATQDLAELKKEHQESEQTLSESDKAYVQRKITAAQQERRIAELLPSCAEKAKELDHLRAQLRSLSSRGQELGEERRLARRRAGELERTVDRLIEDLERARDALQEKMAKRDGVKKSLQAIEEEQKSGDEELRGLAAEVASLQARLGVVEQLLTEREGYGVGVRFLLARADELRGIRGVFGEVIAIQPQYVKALEAALGSAAQYVLTESETAALEALNLLNRDGQGRAFFLPLDSIPSPTSERSDRITFQGEGTVGWAKDFVSCPPEFQRAKEFLLRDVLIVEDLESALKLGRSLRERMSLENGPVIVTLKGEIVRAGVIGGGGTEGVGEGLIGRRAEAGKLRSRLGGLEAAFARKKTRQEEVRASCDCAIQEIQSLDTLIEKDRIALLELEKQVGRLELEKAGLDQKLQSIDSAQKEAELRTAKLAEEIRSAEEQLGEIGKEKKDAESVVEQLRSELSGFEAEKEAKAKAVQELNLKVVSLQWRCNQLKDDLSRLEEIEKEIRGTLQRKGKETGQAKSEISQLDESAGQKGSELEGLRQNRADLEERVRRLGEAHGGLERSIEGIEKEIGQWRTCEQETREKVHELEMRISDLDHRARSRRERIQEEYGVDIDVVEQSEEVDLENAQQTIERLKERIRQLGPVNLLALQEYEEENERYQFLTAQRNDLLEAKESLKQTITEINKTARKRFAKTFGLIRKNFRSTFLQFFGSGQANLMLTPGVDPLEADIEIRACTRGTIPGSIDAFSGGEKTLTAIALLFAIYLVKPSPFCILDEIDAPLDDANIDRFTATLKEFSKSTQFIVVTHNKKTMEAADRLYGVTMEEEGVSKLVSVTFEEPS